MNKYISEFIKTAKTGATKSPAYDRIYGTMHQLADEQVISLVLSCGKASDMNAREIANPLLCELNTRRHSLVGLVIFMWTQGVDGENYARYIAEAEQNNENSDNKEDERMNIQVMMGVDSKTGDIFYEYFQVEESMPKIGDKLPDNSVVSSIEQRFPCAEDKSGAGDKYNFYYITSIDKNSEEWDFFIAIEKEG